MTYPTKKLLAATAINGQSAVNAEGEDLGTIKDIVINVDKGEIQYAVLSFGGFLGLGDKYFAIPWQAFHADWVNERFVLNVDRARLENAPGFDKDEWPDMADPTFSDKVYAHYGFKDPCMPI